MAFKMKGFPMQQTSALKQKVKVFGGRATLDISTDAGKKLLEEINSIKTVKPGELGKASKSASSKVKNILSKHAGKLLKLGVKSSIILNMFDPASAGKGSTVYKPGELDIMKDAPDE